jgi:putative heme-binding domain-containing protein
LFEPSKIIKTGFETELLQTSDGKVISGLVKEEGDSLRVITPDAELVLKKTDVDSRKVQKVSLMPEGQHKTLSAAELKDLLAYLRSLQ